MGYDSYSFFVNGGPMLIISACLLGSTVFVYGTGKLILNTAEKYDNPKMLKVGKTFQKIAWRMPPTIARLAFTQLTFSAALDLRYISTESVQMNTGTYISIMVIVLYSVYAIFEIVMALLYRSYITKNDFQNNS